MAKESKSRLAAVCLAAFAVLAMTGASVAQNQTCGRLPPMRYLHEPTQPYSMQELDWDTLQSKCSFHGFVAYYVWGCADLDANAIYILDDLSSMEKRCVIRHEKAHLNGWAYNHPIR